MFSANSFTLISGTSQNDEFKILSFDNALLDAKVGNYNIVKVSSILPPKCMYSQILDHPQGAVLHMAYASLTLKGTGVASSAVAVGVPKDSQSIGVIMEYSCFEKKEKCIEDVELLVKKAMDKRKVAIKEILSIGCEIELSTDAFSTSFAGLALW